MAEITVLRVSEAGKKAAKSFCLDASGEIQKTSFNAGTWFHYSKKTFEGIKQLSDFLFPLAQDRRVLLIRGVLADNKDPRQPVRRWGVKGHGKDGFFLPAPNGQTWVLLDFDGIPCPTAIDFIKHPAKGIEYLTSLLPKYFHGVSYHYHLSGSAGMDGGKTIRAHIWYWLDHPVREQVLRTWAKSINLSGKLIDGNLFNEVQPHYTADPVFNGVPDPFPNNRSAFVKGKADVVVFPTICVPTPTSSSYAGGLTHSEAFDKFIAAVGDHDGGMGFHEPLMMAAWYYVLDHGVAGTDKAALKQALKQAVQIADSSKHPDKSYITLKGSDGYLTSLIDGAIAKVGAKGKTGKIETLEPHYAAGEVLSARKASEELTELVGSYFESPRNMGIRAGAGLGKTTRVVARAATHLLYTKRLEYYVPTHKLIGEVATMFKHHPFKKSPFKFQPKGVPTGLRIQVIQGRDRPTRSGKPHCLKNDIASLLAARGYSIYPTLCRSAEQSCEYFSECKYISQFSGEYDVRIFSHAYLALDRGFLDSDLPDYAVIDETFYCECRSKREPFGGVVEASPDA